MKKLVFASLTALAVSSIVSGCGKEEDSALNSAADLEGTWVEACSADSEGGSTKGSSTFSGGTATVVAQSYSDASCATESMRFDLTGTYTGGTSLASPAGAKELDSTTTKLVLTLKTDEMVAMFNGAEGTFPPVCGGGFVKDTGKELTAADCANDANFQNIFDVQYSIYKIEGSRLYFGECNNDGSANDCSTAAKRANTFAAEYSTRN